jgi:BTB/POZ domain
VESARDANRDCEVCFANLFLESSQGRKFEIKYNFGVLDSKGEILLRSPEFHSTSDQLVHVNSGNELFSFDEFMVKRSQMMDEKRGVTSVTIVCQISVVKENQAPKSTTDVSSIYEEMFEKGQYNDITIQVDKQLIPAHKFILAQSPIFSDMFKSGWMPRSNVLEISDFSFEVMHAMLRFMYCQKLGKLDDIATDLIMCANRYKLPLLQESCVDWLEKHINIANFAAALIAADLLGIKTLTTVVLKFIIS